MSEQNTPAQVFFQPLPEHDNLNTAYFLARLSEKVILAESGCWEWTGCCEERSGYGQIGIEGPFAPTPPPGGCPRGRFTPRPL